MTDPSNNKDPKPPADEPVKPNQPGVVGAIWQFVSGMLPGGPPVPSQSTRPETGARKGSTRSPSITPQQAQAMLSQLFKLTIEVANGMWRIRRRVQADSAADGEDRFRGLSRHVESTWSAFATHGLEVRDHTGEKYVAGMAMSVVAYQATPGITFEKVLETVRPSIYFQDQLIQRGEVIVATPESMPEMDEPVAPKVKFPAAEEAAAQAAAAQEVATEAAATEAAATEAAKDENPPGAVDAQAPSDEPENK